MPRDPQQIQLEIDAAREALATTLDELVYRGSPDRLRAKGQLAAQKWLASPAGKATLGAVGVLVTFIVVQKIRHRHS